MVVNSVKNRMTKALSLRLSLYAGAIMPKVMLVHVVRSCSSSIDTFPSHSPQDIRVHGPPQRKDVDGPRHRPLLDGDRRDASDLNPAMHAGRVEEGP